MKLTRNIINALAIFLIALTSCLQLFAQNELNFDQLKTPTSPAFIIIDQTPSTIDRPSSLNALTTSVQGAYVGGKFKPGLGIEVTPFWLFKKTNYSLDKYLLARFGKDHGRLFLRHLSLSFATSSTDTLKLGRLTPGLGLSYGIRFLIIPGVEPEKERAEKMRIIEQSKIELGYKSKLSILKFSLTGDNIDNTTLVTKATAALTAANGALIHLIEEKFKGQDPIQVQAVKDYIDELRAKEDKELIKNAIAISSWLSSAREGFMWEFAAAGLHNLPESNVNGQGNELAKISAWTTFSYRANLDKNEVAQSLDVMVLLRYIYNNKKVDSSDYFDIGIKGAYNYKKWSLSFEAAYRRALTKMEVDATVPDNERPKRYTYRLAASFDYQINTILGLNISFGRQFDGRTTTFLKNGTGQSIFSTAGLNIGIGQLSKTN